MKVNLIIPAKGYTKKLKNKNFFTVESKTLIEMVCEKALNCKNIHNVYLDTECDKIKALVSHLFAIGLKIINRPKSLTCDSITASDMMIYGLHSTSECDLLVQTFPTSPLLSSETIDLCIEKFINSHDSHDSFITVCPMKEFLWKNKVKAETINFDKNKQPRSSELEELLIETHGLYGVKVDSLLKNKNRIGNKPMLINIPKIESYHVNSEQDLEIIKKLFLARSE